MERPQRPRVSESAEAHLRNFPPAIHPREPPVSRLPLLIQQRFRTSHACTGSTLRHGPGKCNKELQPGCAEAVEEPDSLWKAQEKAGENAAAENFLTPLQRAFSSMCASSEAVSASISQKCSLRIPFPPAPCLQGQAQQNLQAEQAQGSRVVQGQKFTGALGGQAETGILARQC